MCRVLLAFAHRDLVARHADACQKAGLKLAGIDLDAFALLRSLSEPRGGRRGADPGGRRGRDRSRAHGVRGLRRPASATSSACSSGAAAHSTSRSPTRSTCRLDMAHEVKHQLVLGGRRRTRPTVSARCRSRRRARPCATSCGCSSQEIVSSLRFYQTRPGSLAIGELLVTGGGAELPGLAEELERLVGVPVRAADPLGRVHARQEGQAAGRGGLVRRRDRAGDRGLMRAVNLLPSEPSGRRKQMPSGQVLLASTAPLVAAALVYLAFSFEQCEGLERAGRPRRRADRARRSPPCRVAAGAASTQLASEQTQRLLALQDALGRRVAWDRILDQVARVLPANVWLTQLNALSPDPDRRRSASGAAAPARRPPRPRRRRRPAADSAPPPAAPRRRDLHDHRLRIHERRRGAAARPARARAEPDRRDARLDRGGGDRRKAVVQFKVTARCDRQVRVMKGRRHCWRSSASSARAGLAVAGLLLVVQPQRDKVKSLHAEFEQAQTQIVDRGDARRREVGGASQIFQLSRAMPSPDDMPGDPARPFAHGGRDLDAADLRAPVRRSRFPTARRRSAAGRPGRELRGRRAVPHQPPVTRSACRGYRPHATSRLFLVDQVRSPRTPLDQHRRGRRARCPATLNLVAFDYAAPAPGRAACTAGGRRAAWPASSATAAGDHRQRVADGAAEEAHAGAGPRRRRARSRPSCSAASSSASR